MQELEAPGTAGRGVFAGRSSPMEQGESVLLRRGKGGGRCVSKEQAVAEKPDRPAVVCVRDLR